MSKRVLTEQELFIRKMDKVCDFGDNMVVKVPGVGTAWQQRGTGYWWRRFGMVMAALLGSGLVGGMAFGFGLGFYRDGGGIVPAICYWSTGLLGILFARWVIKDAPAAPRTPPWMRRGSGLVALCLAPASAVALLILLVLFLRRDFPGERRAREYSAARAAVHQRDLLLSQKRHDIRTDN